MLDPAAAKAIATGAIPVRRYSTVPPLADDEPAWEIEASAPSRTIADHGRIAVLLAALVAAALGAWLLYLR